MKLAISNIGWNGADDEKVYALMKKYGFSGLEVAPTRLFSEPYKKNEEAHIWSEQLKKTYGFDVPSMQSIWFGRQEKLFGTDEERQVLEEYTKAAIKFAAAISCKNLVFGCPRNRNMPVDTDCEGGTGSEEQKACEERTVHEERKACEERTVHEERKVCEERTVHENQVLAAAFFKRLGAYAAECGTAIGMEANPPIYHTNYINDTASALCLIREVDSPGFRLNLDTGTMIENKEDVSVLSGNVHLIQHVHISEPGLAPIKERALHRELKELLAEGGYQGFVSIEMQRTEDLSVLEKTMDYVRRVFA